MIQPSVRQSHTGPASVRIRQASEADLAALVALEECAFPGDRLSRAQYRRHLASERACVLVVDAAEAGLLGSALIFFRRGSVRARLYSIATAPAARGLGVGRRLLEACEAAARVRGCTALRLEVRVDNAAAIALYESAGYRRFGHRAAYYEDGADAWRYEKELAIA